VTRIDVPRQLKIDAVDVTIESAAKLRAKRQIGGAGVLVGVIDSEVQADHPALGGRVVHRRNYTQEPFGTPDSHGTAVAGLIAAEAGFTGMAPEAQIYNYKVLATQSALNSTDFEGGLAIQHALEDGVRVVNCSWGSGPASDGSGREARACDTAWRLGLVIVKSAGNNGPGAQTLTTPADAEGVLVVGATSVDGTTVPDYSSRGPTPDGRQRPHVVAPGGEFDAPIDGIMLGGASGTLADVGTSFAAPHVTGLVALLVGSEPKLTPDQVRERVIKTCQQLAGASPAAQGAGLVTPADL
jgi:serine protease AprX